MGVEIFISYAHEDEAMLNELKKRLRAFQRQGLIDIIWYDRNISAGKEWEREVDQHLNSAHIILLLISPDFIVSDYCYSVELQQALERHERGEARVIPVILRVVDWQEPPLGTLQALPPDSMPVKSWPDIDSAYFEVARGIRKVVEEITIQLLARKISLFGYETDGGTNSVLWRNPLNFSHKKDYEVWWSMKRRFTEEEIVNQTWVKVSSYGDYWTVRFLSNGRLTEGPLSDPDRWEGSWKLIDGMLRINIGSYEMDVFANRENSTYSAIEFNAGHKEPFAYYVFFSSSDAHKARHWELNDASTLIDQICEQVLNRKAEPVDFILFGSLLHRGEKSVRDVVKLLGLSPGYRKRFINAQIMDKAVEFCYEHFLGREGDDVGKAHYINKVKKTGFDALIVELIESGEYKKEFGEDDIPSGYWLETSISTIRIRLVSPRPLATVHRNFIPARGHVHGLPTNERYFIVGYVITDKEYEQGRAPIDGDGSWTIDEISLGATNHHLFFRIIDESKRLIAESKETTILRS